MRCASLKTLNQHTVSNNKQHTMSKQVLISLLAQGNTGNEILQILNSLAEDAVSDTQEGESAD